MLSPIENAINEHKQSELALQQEMCDVLTPKQGSSVNFEIAEENYLRATKKMNVNVNAVSGKAIERRAYHMVPMDQPARPFSKASSLSPELTMRSQQTSYNNRPSGANLQKQSLQPRKPKH